MNAVEIKNVRKEYPGFCLGPLDLVLPSGCILGLVGENGAGKSTTIKLILDMIRPKDGSITVLGRDNRKDLHLTKENIGVVLDDVGIPDCLDTTQVGKVMSGIYRNWDQQVYNDYLDRLSIPKGKAFKDFSRGNKMKLGIAIALSHGAKLLILDEATSGLDPVVRDEVVTLFHEFTRDPEHAVLISSHIVSDLEKLCDYIAFLHQGKLLLLEEKDVLLGDYAIVHGTAQQLSAIDTAAVIGSKANAYGGEMLVKRSAVPDDMAASPITIEELFLFMIKEAK